LGGVLHPLGRALPVAEVVTAVGYVGELTKPHVGPSRRRAAGRRGVRLHSPQDNHIDRDGRVTESQVFFGGRFE
jgi:hypothetical protein